MFRIWTKSAEEVIEFLKLKTSADRDIATHCVPAFASVPKI